MKKVLILGGIITFLTNFNPSFAKSKDKMITPYLGFNNNIYSELQEQETIVGGWHKKSGLGIELIQGKLYYTESKVEKNPEPLIDRVEGRLDAEASKEGMAIRYMTEPWENIFTWTKFGESELKGKAKATVTAYSIPPFNQVLTEEEKANIKGKCNEVEFGIGFGDENIMVGLGANYTKIRLGYDKSDTDEKIVEGLIGKLEIMYKF